MADKKAAKATDDGWQERLSTLGRNDECTCGSHKKYKKCHLEADEKMKSGEISKVNEAAKAKYEKEAAEHDHAGHDHDHDHPHGHPGHGHAPNAQHKPPTVQVKQVSAPRKVGSGG
jgi:hypothetical protein